MPPRPWPKRVADIIDAARQALEITRDLDYGAFAADRRAREAALYNLVIIGEAAKFIPADIQARCPDVDWNGLKDTRNFVTHVYHAVSYRRVWRTVRVELPVVIASLQKLLADEAASQDDAG